jgi:hypothetical protein
MIIGAILETSSSPQGGGGSGHNGAALMHFYSMADAIAWAEIQSGRVVFGTGNAVVYAVCTVTNTDSGEFRWWYDGTEYTG